MEKYVVLMDVSGDVHQCVVDEYGLKFISMQYSLGEDMRTSYGREDEAIMKKFYDGQRTGDLTRTSQITPFMYEEYFDEYLKQGYSILYLALSSGLSSTFSAACLAKETLEKKYPDLKICPVDSLSASGGMGILIETALENQRQGLSIEENQASLEKLVPHATVTLMVQDLMYLKRGGRVSATTAAFGSMLNIKPILKLNSVGKLETIAKKRGNKAALKYLYEAFVENYDPSCGKVVYIADADCKNLSLELAEMIQKNYPDAVIRQVTECPIIGAHTGPGTILLCYYSK